MNYSEPWTTEEKNTLPLSYKCEVLFTDVTDDSVNNNNLPSDSYLIYYKDSGGSKLDICRAARMVNIFDLYYDRFGSSLKRIDYTKGRANPKVWGENNRKKEESNKKR